MRNQVSLSLIFALISAFVFASLSSTAEARRGCCSHHGGVCGCLCCDGTSLSAKCAPYYSNCGSGKSSTVRSMEKANKPKEKGITAYVVKIVDGDTIKVRFLPGRKVSTVRILGIDCPESHKNQKCMKDGKQGRKGCDWQIPRGLRASKKAAELLKAGSIALECDGDCKKGIHGRHLRYVRLDDGRDYGFKMVAMGFCEDFGWKYPHPRMREYQAAQDGAKAAGKGIWGDE